MMSATGPAGWRASQSSPAAMFFLRFVYRNLFRHPLRSGLTVLGIVIAVLAYGMLRTMIDSWYAGVRASQETRLVTRNAVSLSFRLPLAYRSRIKQVPGVTTVSYASWFGGVYVSEKEFFAQFAVDPESYLQLYPEFVLSPGEKSAFIRNRNAAVAGRKLAAKYGWKIGDSIPLRGTVYPGSWNFVLQGVYRGAEEKINESMLFIHWDVLNERLKETLPSRANVVGAYIVGIDNADRAAEISRDIDRLFRNSRAETLTETETAFELNFVSMSKNIILAIESVSLVVVLIIVLVVANTMAMNVKERLREYATLQALGFQPRYVFGLILGESLMISLGAGILGVLFIEPVAFFLRPKVDKFFAVFIVSEQTIWIALGIALLIGFLASLIPIWHMKSLSVTQGLRDIG